MIKNSNIIKVYKIITSCLICLAVLSGIALAGDGIFNNGNLEINGRINATTDVYINNTLYADKIVGKTNTGIGYGGVPVNGYRHYFYGSANNFTVRIDSTTSTALYIAAASGTGGYFSSQTGVPLQTYSSGGVDSRFGTTPQTNNSGTAIQNDYAYKKSGANMTTGWGITKIVNLMNNENTFKVAFTEGFTWLNSSTGTETSRVYFQTIANGSQGVRMTILHDGLAIGTQTQQTGYNVTIAGALYVGGNVTASGLFTHSYAFTGNATDRIKLMKANMSTIGANGWANSDHSTYGDIAVLVPYSEPIYLEEEIIGYEQKYMWLTDQERLTDMGIKAIQELITENEQLTIKDEQLEARLAIIEARLGIGGE